MKTTRISIPHEVELEYTLHKSTVSLYTRSNNRKFLELTGVTGIKTTPTEILIFGQENTPFARILL